MRDEHDDETVTGGPADDGHRDGRAGSGGKPDAGNGYAGGVPESDAEAAEQAANTRAGARRRPQDEPCRNCGDPRTGQYCPTCGQRKVDVQVSVRMLLADVLEDQFVINPALPRTLRALLLQPGRLTNEYIRGRVVSYIAPFRMYLVASVVFFLVISFVGLRALDRASLAPQNLSTQRDTLRMELEQRRSELLQTDTAALGPIPRAIMRQALESNQAAIEQLADTTAPLEFSRYVNIVRLARGDAAVGHGELQPWAQEITIEAGGSWYERALRRKLDQVGHLPPREAVRLVLDDMLSYAPHAMFILLPLYAALLKLLYVRRGRFYAEHFVFALHVHAFFFLVFVMIVLSPWRMLDRALILWLLVYMWLAMKRVYRQGWFRTTVKWGVLGWTYATTVLLAVVTITFAALLL